MDVFFFLCRKQTNKQTNKCLFGSLVSPLGLEMETIWCVDQHMVLSVSHSNTQTHGPNRCFSVNHKIIFTFFSFFSTFCAISNVQTSKCSADMGAVTFVFCKFSTFQKCLALFTNVFPTWRFESFSKQSLSLATFLLLLFAFSYF